VLSRATGEKSRLRGSKLLCLISIPPISTMKRLWLNLSPTRERATTGGRYGHIRPLISITRRIGGLSSYRLLFKRSRHYQSSGLRKIQPVTEFRKFWFDFDLVFRNPGGTSDPPTDLEAYRYRMDEIFMSDSLMD
jgi:hypothetical protein